MKRILIVDDSKSVRLSLREMLEKEGYETVEAVDGARGLEAACAGHFDMVITDIDMPVMDGFALCEALKQRPETRPIPIMIFSSLDTEERVEAGFQLGAWAFVPKNRPQDLIEGVRSWQERHLNRSPYRVLVVDDSPVVLKAVEEELACDGYVVDCASDGEQAWRKLGEGPKPDIVVTDLHMPGLDGIGLIGRMRRALALSGIPAVVMSTDGGRAAIMKAMQAGASSYLTKPFGSGQLATHLDRILNDQFRILNETRIRLEHEHALLMAALSSLVNALEAKDSYTRGHSESVARMAVRIGRELGLGEAVLERLSLSGRLHDLGKIGIRDEVLFKNGQLTPQEYEHIKEHPRILQTILEPIPSVQDILEGAYAHHERWDGSGYPRGLARLDIPLFGRILAVADVFDALTSDRSYRKQLPPAAAVQLIRNDIGSHFCPEVGAAFLRLMA